MRFETAWGKRYITYMNVSKGGFLISRSSKKLLLAIVPQSQLFLCGSKTSGASPRPHEPRRVAKKIGQGLPLCRDKNDRNFLSSPPPPFSETTPTIIPRGSQYRMATPQGPLMDRPWKLLGACLTQLQALLKLSRHLLPLHLELSNALSDKLD